MTNTKLGQVHANSGLLLPSYMFTISTPIYLLLFTLVNTDMGTFLPCKWTNDSSAVQLPPEYFGTFKQGLL